MQPTHALHLLGNRNTLAYKLNGVLMVVVFFLVRFLLLAYYWHRVFSELDVSVLWASALGAVHFRRGSSRSRRPLLGSRRPVPPRRPLTQS